MFDKHVCVSSIFSLGLANRNVAMSTEEPVIDLDMDKTK